MGIEDRIRDVDLNSSGVNTNFRAAIHKRFSEAPVNLNTIRQLLVEDFTKPTGAQLTRRMHELHTWLLSSNMSRDIITLSPLGVFGLDQVLTSTSPLKIAHVTGKPADIVADPPIQLAGEAFRRRRAEDVSELNLGAFHQCTRLQKYTDPLYKPVFEMFGTLDSIPRSLNEEFEIEKIAQLIDGYAQLIRRFASCSSIEIVLGHVGIAGRIVDMNSKQRDVNLQERVDVVTSAIPATLIGNLDEDILYSGEVSEFSRKYKLTREIDDIKNLALVVKPMVPDARLFVYLNRIQGVGHYKGLVFMMFANEVDVVDGGVVDWVSKLTANAKERTVVSGLGTTLLMNSTKNR